MDQDGALAVAASEDAAAKAGGSRFQRGLMWGVPIVIKANTSVKGMVTTDGWRGYMIPGHELIAPRDATVVAKLRAAGAVIIGQTNMPDFAASDTTRSSAFGRTGNAYDVRFSPVVRLVEPLPPSLPTLRSWEPEQIPPIPSACPQPPAR